MRTISVHIEDADCDDLDSLLKGMGLSRQAFYESCTKAALRLRRLPFPLEAPEDPFYSEANKARLRRSFRQAEEGKLIRKTMAQLEAMAEDA